MPQTVMNRFPYLHQGQPVCSWISPLTLMQPQPQLCCTDDWPSPLHVGDGCHTLLHMSCVCACRDFMFEIRCVSIFDHYRLQTTVGPADVAADALRVCPYGLWLWVCRPCNNNNNGLLKCGGFCRLYADPALDNLLHLHSRRTITAKHGANGNPVEGSGGPHRWGAYYPILDDS